MMKLIWEKSTSISKKKHIINIVENELEVNEHENEQEDNSTIWISMIPEIWLYIVAEIKLPNINVKKSEKNA